MQRSGEKEKRYPIFKLREDPLVQILPANFSRWLRAVCTKVDKVGKHKWVNDPDLPRGWKVDGTENCRIKVTSMETEGKRPHGCQSVLMALVQIQHLINFPKAWSSVDSDLPPFPIIMLIY
jgi:hypothetical protein